MDSVEIVLNTRHCTLDTAGDFSKCRWVLPDPIIAPAKGEYVLKADVKFVSIPLDYTRINAERRTTKFLIQVRENDQIDDVVFTVRDGSYERVAFITHLNRRFFSLGLELRVNQAQFHTDYDHVPFTFLTQEVLIYGTSLTKEYRMVHSEEYRGPEVLGFYKTTNWVKSQVFQLSPAVMDTFGTRTITIGARGLAGPSPDPVNLERRKTILMVIPTMTNSKHETGLYLRNAPRSGHVIHERCLSYIELTLWDDMGLLLNPRHHWSIGIEIWAEPVKNFVSLM